MEQNVTPLETIRLASQGTLVEIPGFTPEAPITVRLRKPNMLTLMKSGKVPNTLMDSATGLFGSGAKKDGKTGYSSQEMSELFTMMESLCEASLVAPTWKELKDANIELTQEQMIFIFQYTQGGVKALEPFRGEPGNHTGSVDGGEVSMPTEHSDGN